MTAALLGGLSLLVLASGCSAETDATSTDDAAMIGGKLPAGPELDAVGRVVIGGIGGCVGTLVAPQVVVSARHCRVFAARDGADVDAVQFEVGPGGGKRRFTVVAELTTGRPGVGMLGVGRDVAMLMLAEPVPSTLAKPIAVRERPLDASDVGRKLTGVAFDSVRVWIKTIGRSTLDATEGRPYEKAFRSFAEMKAAAEAQIEAENRSRPYGLALDLDEAAYASELSLEANEVHVGLGPHGRARGDVQFCRGDSGGPLLDRVDGHYELVGVITGGEGACVLGGVVTRLDAEDVRTLARCGAGPAPWSWACDPAKSAGPSKAKRCASGTRVSCGGRYFDEAHRFTEINVGTCSSG